jgi:hypothetical protein
MNDLATMALRECRDWFVNERRMIELQGEDGDGEKASEIGALLDRIDAALA